MNREWVDFAVGHFTRAEKIRHARQKIGVARSVRIAGAFGRRPIAADMLAIAGELRRSITPSLPSHAVRHKMTSAPTPERKAS